MRTLLYFIFFTTNLLAQEPQHKEIVKTEEELKDKKFLLMPHKGSFLIPFSYNNNPNNDVFNKMFDQDKLDSRGDYNRYLEAEFQVSFLVLTIEDIFQSNYSGYMGYTTHSWWQVYNEEWSRPFRESNYELEFFARNTHKEKLSIFGGKLLSHSFGFVHQSNGQVQELSRSWNRYFFNIELVYSSILLSITAWHITNETINGDDNPDIYKYRGYGSLAAIFKKDKVALTYKLTPGTLKMGHEFSLQGPMSGGLNYYIKFNYGYGESMIDYNHENRRLGVGIILENPYINKL